MGYKILLLGTLTSEEQNRVFITKGIRPAPADIVQKYLLDGFGKDERVDEVCSICAARIPAYNKSGVKKVESDIIRINKGEVYSVGYNNMLPFAFINRELNILKEVKKWIFKQSKDDKHLIFIFSMHSPFLKAGKYIKNLLPNSVVSLIVPDLPAFMGDYGIIKKTLKWIDSFRINRMLPIVDCYMLYTKYMADYFKIPDGKWIVFEGLIDEGKISENLECVPKCNEPKVCIYAGSMRKQFAIDLLIDAFTKIDNAELHLYGNKEMALSLINGNSNISNVKYMGVLSQEEMFSEMKKADLLINPRPSSLELAKYSCPSKTFEYMASGTPVVMTKLPGLPEEYYDYLYFFENETVDGFATTLNTILAKNDSELRKTGLAAQEFLLKNKTSEKQAKRLIDFCVKD